MQRELRHGLERVFSILPEERVADAVVATIRRLNDVGTARPALLKWADFDGNGRFLRGGVSDLKDYRVQFVVRPEDDPDLAAMVREAADGLAEPGRVICSADRKRFTLFLPDTHSTAETLPTLRVRGFVVDMEVFTRIHLAFEAGARLTEAERRVSFQLVAGVSLRKAAALDEVSVETKRAQLKSAAAKMRCSGQVDLVRLLVGQLSILRSIVDDEARHAEFATRYVSGRLDGDARLVVERLPTGRVLRCVEVGPENGRPVVVLHGMMFGMLLSGARRHLEAAGLRLLMPVRQGYLDPRPTLDLTATSRLIDESLADLSQFLKRRGPAPAALLGHSLGGALALRFAARHPNLVPRLVVASINTAGADERRDEPTDRLYGGYRSLGGETSLSRAITLEFSHHYPDRDTSQAMLDRMFAASEGDRQAMAGAGAAAPVQAWFPELYRSSVTGIAEDYDCIMGLRSLDPMPRMPCLFVHGEADPLTPVAEVERLSARTPNGSIVKIPGAGHFASSSHAAEVWSAVARFLPDE